MASNPLQQYFRQPKIYISLPSKGVYNAPGSVQGDVSKIAVYGMTGMDEIIAKTPDALLSGESTVKLVESCCPSIKNAWDLSTLDSDLVFTAIRIATYGNMITVSQTCVHCNERGEYEIDLGTLIDHFSKCQFDSKVVTGDLIIKVQPLTYKKKTEFAMRNFQLQQRLNQVEFLEDKEKQQTIIQELFRELGVIQHDLYVASVESVEVNGQLVEERAYLNEWLQNCDKSIFDDIKAHIEKNQETWRMPKFPGKCVHCSKDIETSIELDQSNFFV